MRWQELFTQIGLVINTREIEAIANYDQDQHWLSNHFFFDPISEQRIKQIAETVDLRDKTVRIVTETEH